MADQVQYYGTGRRKSSVARVFLRPGSGEFTVNGKPFDAYFVTAAQRIMAKSAMVLTETTASFNVLCTVDGGGVNGAGLQQPPAGGVVGRPPHEAGRRPMALERSGQKGKGRIASCDRQGRSRGGDRLDVDERTCRRGLQAGRMGERRPETWGEP